MRDFLGRRAWAWLAAAFALLYAVNLGASELSAVDEARTAMIARDMAQGGNWLLPRTPDGYLSEKPPVYYAMAAAASLAFGEGEGPLRGVSVLLAIGTLAVVGWTAAWIGSPRTAVVAVGVLGSNILFMAWARTAMVDMTFTFFFTAGMAAYVAARLGKLGPWSASALCGISFGLAVLSKGPLGLAFPAAAAVLDVLVASRGRFWKAPIPWAAAGLASLIIVELSLIWYLPGAIAGGREFLHTSLLDENVYMPLGMAQGIAGSHVKAPWYYPVRQLMVLLPMAALLPEAIRRLARRDAGPSRTLLATWAAAGFLVLLAASNKRWYYLLPLQPVLALLVAVAIAPLWDSVPPNPLRWGTRLMGGFMAAGALIVVACSFHDPAPTAPEDTRRFLDLMQEHRGWLALAGAAFVGAGILMVASSFSSNFAMIRAVLLAGLLGAGFRTLMLDPIRGTEDQYRPFAAEMSQRLPPGASVAVWPPGHGYGLDFYWPTRLARGVAAASASEYVIVRQIQIPDLPFPVDTLGLVEFSSDARRIALVRRK
jgi:4-amino-4-deoxy-L-arabinose transferase-like glycosyltransferase